MKKSCKQDAKTVRTQLKLEVITMKADVLNLSFPKFPIP